MKRIPRVHVPALIVLLAGMIASGCNAAGALSQSALWPLMEQRLEGAQLPSSCVGGTGSAESQYDRIASSIGAKYEKNFPLCDVTGSSLGTRLNKLLRLWVSSVEATDARVTAAIGSVSAGDASALSESLMTVGSLDSQKYFVGPGSLQQKLRQIGPTKSIAIWKVMNPFDEGRAKGAYQVCIASSMSKTPEHVNLVSSLDAAGAMCFTLSVTNSGLAFIRYPQYAGQ